MSEQLNTVIIQAIQNKKGVRIINQDLRGFSDICNNQIICSAQNEKQAQAIADGICAEVKASLGIHPGAVEGKEKGHWVLVDFGSTIVHVFHDYLRDYYALEELWPKSKFIRIDG